MINYAELNEQKIFDIVAEHLFKQGERSINEQKKCLYRGPNGLKCAVGALMNDEDYDPIMDEDNCSVNSLTISFKNNKFVKEVAILYYDLLSKLQSIHDHTLNWETEEDLEELKKNLSKAAKTFELDSSILKNLHFLKQ